MFDVIVAVITPTHGVIGTVVMPHVMSRVLSLCGHVLCHGCCRYVAMVGIVLRSHLLRGCGGCHHAVFCVIGAVIAWPWWVLHHIATVGVIMLCFVSWVL
jgi:hypothetical protein